MMNFEEFSKTVLKEIQKKTEGRFHVSKAVNMKNNGMKCTGISAAAKDSNNGICIYLDAYYKEYKDGNIKLHNIADEVCTQILGYQNDLQHIDTMDLLNWKYIKRRIYAK